MRRAACATGSLAAALACALLALVPPARACVGDGCLNIYATAAGGGQLTTSWNFARPVQTFLSLCAAGICRYSAIDPGFREGEAPAPEGLHPLADGTRISVEVVARDAAVRFRLDGADVEVGGRALLGTTPGLHSHPTWQLSLPEGTLGAFPLSFRLVTDSPAYAASDTFTILLTNQPTPTPDGPTASPSPTPTATARDCPGDCSGDGEVVIAELIAGVAAALAQQAPCAAMDRNGDGSVVIGELIAAVNALLGGCPSAASPTPTQPVTLARIQAEIFAPRCAVPTCHDSTYRTGDLVLDADRAYDDLVRVAPAIDVAREAGLLRVDPGDPANSFLLVKLDGPPRDQGSRMPLTGPLLSDAEVELIRAWIAAGAPR